MTNADQAIEVAARAAAAARVTVREISSLPEIEEIVRLYSVLWGRDKNPPVTVELLKAFSKVGNYIGGAFDGNELLGACVGFFSAPAQEALHSHIAGVSAAARGRNVGFALKLHQRAWALSRGVREIAWTFDPLVSRNAYFNVEKLGAEPVEYLPDFYGGMTDLINGGDPSDRILVRWRLASDEVAAACAGHRPPADAAEEQRRGAVLALGVTESGDPAEGGHDADVVIVTVPTDIEAMRTTDPDRAGRWRVSVRSALSGLMSSGYRVGGFDRTGRYILQREESR